MALGKGKESEENKSTFAGLASSVPQGKLEAFLGQGSKVVGKLNFSGPVEIGGFVEGELVADKALTISESAVVNARVQGTDIIVRGTVNGDIHASVRLSLKAPAKVVGNISSKNLSIEEGVVFEGKCSMDGVAPAQGSSAGKERANS